jgi:exopolysaccharide biosynthesis WecB/TagA/CpsF family protein
MQEFSQTFQNFRDPIFIGFKNFYETKKSNLFTATWVNHFSVKVLWKSNRDLKSIDLIGVDGIFLDYLMGIGPQRSSADLVLPEILKSYKLKVGIYGGKASLLNQKIHALEYRFPGTQVVLAIDGYSDIDNSIFLSKINGTGLDLLIVGAGSPKQEEFLRLVYNNKYRIKGKIAVLTCGGWLDQILYKNYYPKWAYRFKLNWLVRMIRDPRRLWKRYLVLPPLIFLNRKKIGDYLSQAPGYQNFRREQLGLLRND